jgi:fructokinase
LRNANFKLHLDGTAESFVLRIYEHDASLCQKEIDLMCLVCGSVPVPELVHAEPNGFDDLQPFTITRHVEGMTFLELKRTENADAIAQAAYSAGETLAAIGRFRFPKPGWLAPGPTVAAPLLEGADPMPRFVELCLASVNFEQRMPADLRKRVSTLLVSFIPQLRSVQDQACLVHGDFNRRNLLVRPIGGRWSVAAVLDWEFAVSGSPVADLGTFLRYEPRFRPIAEPDFSTGYLNAGGELPPDWWRIARIVDLTALCESLAHEDLSSAIAKELVELVRATAEDRDVQSG